MARLVQGALAALLIAASIAWSLDLFRAVGLVLFSEQFAAAAYGIGLTLTFLRFRARAAPIAEAGQTGSDSPVPWYDWLFAALSLAVWVI